jgi:hypothetical protein
VAPLVHLIKGSEETIRPWAACSDGPARHKHGRGRHMVIECDPHHATNWGKGSAYCANSMAGVSSSRVAYDHAIGVSGYAGVGGPAYDGVGGPC